MPDPDDMAEQIAALKDALRVYQMLNDARFVTGPGFSGNLGNGLSWNPVAADAVPGGGADGPQTPANPYTMLDSGSTANTDTWPAVNSGGLYDGVIVTSWLRVVTDGGTSVAVGGMTLTVFGTTVFVRGAEWDVNGNLMYIGPEETLSPGLTFVTLT